MPKLRFRHVEAFKAVMLAGSITGAASTLHVTQSAVSHLISETEDLLGFPLFDLAPGGPGDLGRASQRPAGARSSLTKTTVPPLSGKSCAANPNFPGVV